MEERKKIDSVTYQMLFFSISWSFCLQEKLCRVVCYLNGGRTFGKVSTLYLSDPPHEFTNTIYLSLMFPLIDQIILWLCTTSFDRLQFHCTKTLLSSFHKRRKIDSPFTAESSIIIIDWWRMFQLILYSRILYTITKVRYFILFSLLILSLFNFSHFKIFLLKVSNFTLIIQNLYWDRLEIEPPHFPILELIKVYTDSS